MYTVASAAPYSLQELATLFGRCFEGYFVPVGTDTGALAARNAAEHVNLHDSLIAYADGAAVGIALMARRGTESRVAAMGIATDWRGKGVGKVLLTEVVAQARQRGDTRILLEVIDQNAPAIRLYEGGGFTILRSLKGYTRPPQPGDASALRTCPTAEVARQVALHGDADLPWQAQAATLAGCVPPFQGFVCGEAYALGVVGPEVVQLRAIVVPAAARGRGEGRRLLDALSAGYPDHRLAVGSIVPEDTLGGFFTRCGFGLAAINQYEMGFNVQE